MQFLPVFYSKNGYTYVAQYYVIHTMSVFLKFDDFIKNLSGKFWFLAIFTHNKAKFTRTPING